jgi:hypothetical protein
VLGLTEEVHARVSDGVNLGWDRVVSLRDDESAGNIVHTVAMLDSGGLSITMLIDPMLRGEFLKMRVVHA